MEVAGAYITVSGGGGEVDRPGARCDPPAGHAAAASPTRPTRSASGCARSCTVAPTSSRSSRPARCSRPGTKPGAPEYTEGEMRAAVEEAAKYGTFVAAHAHGAEGIKRAVRAGVRSIEHGSLIDDEGIALMKQHGHLAGGRHLQRRLHRRGGPARRLVGRDPAQERRDHRDPARGLPQGGRGGREDRLRHRQRGLSSRPQRARSCPTWSSTA